MYTEIGYIELVKDYIRDPCNKHENGRFIIENLYNYEKMSNTENAQIFLNSSNFKNNL